MFGGLVAKYLVGKQFILRENDCRPQDKSEEDSLTALSAPLSSFY